MSTGNIVKYQLLLFFYHVTNHFKYSNDQLKPNTFQNFFQDLLGLRIFIFKVLLKSIQEKYLNFSNPGKWTGIDFDSELSFTVSIITILLFFVKFSFKKSNLKVTNAKRKKKGIRMH